LFKKNKALLIIVAFVILVLAVLIILNFNQTFVDEKYCDGVTIGCQRVEDETGKESCVNSLQNIKNTYYNSPYYCTCNITEKICEGYEAKLFLDHGEKIQGKTCSDEKDCMIEGNHGLTYTKCIAENIDSTEGKCSKWDVPEKGCNYYMIEGKSKEICYS